MPKLRKEIFKVDDEIIYRKEGKIWIPIEYRDQMIEKTHRTQ